MIVVNIKPTYLTVSGHAARPPGVPPGQNIICAAVSALTLTLIEGLRMVAGIWIETEEKEGNVCIKWITLNEKAQTLLDTWIIGMKCIRDSYGEIIIKE